MSTDSCYESDAERAGDDDDDETGEGFSPSSDCDPLPPSKSSPKRDTSDDDEAISRIRVSPSPSPSSRSSTASPARGLLPKTKALIIEGIGDCLSFNGIASKLRLHGLTVPTMTQLVAFVEWYKRRTGDRLRQGAQFDFTLADLIDYASSRTAIPKDPNRPYVLSFFIERTASGKLGFQVIWTTVNMLRVQSQSPSLHIDARHRLSWQGYPVIVAGAVDANHSFFPISLTLLSDVDDPASFRSLMTTLQAAVCSHKQHYTPKVLITDHLTPALTRAVTELYPTASHAVCWTHIRAELERELSTRVSAKRARASAWEAIELLRQAENEQQFIASANLLVEEWKREDEEMRDFADYFAQRWLATTSPKGWYEGRSPCSVSNAGIEQLVAGITDSNRWRNHLAYRQFFHQVEQLCSSWSSKRNPSTFMTSPSISQSLLTDAAEYGSVSEPMLRRTDKDCGGRELIAMAGDGIGAPRRLTDLAVAVDAYLNTVRQRCTVDTWAKFKQLRFGVVIMERCVDVEGFKHWRCNCPTGIANRPCKHVVLHRIRLGELACPVPRSRKGTLQSTENPVETNPDGVPIKRKRGRPRKIRPIDNAVDDDLHMQLAHKIARIETSSPMRAAAVPVVL